IIHLEVINIANSVYEMKFKPHPVYKPGQPVPNGKIVTLGTVTANTKDGRLVQVRVALQLSAVANAKQEAADTPQLTNAVISDLADFTYAQLLTNTARSELQAQLLTAFQKVLGTVDGAAQQVNAVYFTSFILQ
ncbi:MAG: flagellar basal body-associated FliL family protein, partial [Acidimicrobiales bacterium]